MSHGIVIGIRSNYPTPLGSQHAAFLIDLATTLRMGLLRKDSGTNILLPDGTRVAQDIVVFPPNHTGTCVIVDVLQDGEGAANPVWNVGGDVPQERLYWPPAVTPNTSTPVSPAPITPTGPIVLPFDPTSLQQEIDNLQVTIGQFTHDVNAKLTVIASRLTTLEKTPMPTVAEGRVSITDAIRGTLLRWELKGRP